jgi:hypothetical protein
MRINRLAIVALAVGSLMLGSSAAGVTAIGGSLPEASALAAPPQHGDHDHDHGHGHGAERGL